MADTQPQRTDITLKVFSKLGLSHSFLRGHKELILCSSRTTSHPRQKDLMLGASLEESAFLKGDLQPVVAELC